MKRLLALHSLTEIVKKLDIAQSWSTNPLIKTPIFNEVMSKNHFQIMLGFLYFNANSNCNPNDPDCNWFYKVKPLIEHLVLKLKQAYKPTRVISMKGELMLWKRQLQFKQYTLNKRSRFGIKFFSLCEVSGYLWNFTIYLGKQKNVPATEAELVQQRVCHK